MENEQIEQILLEIEAACKKKADKNINCQQTSCNRTGCTQVQCKATDDEYRNLYLKTAKELKEAPAAAIITFQGMMDILIGRQTEKDLQGYLNIFFACVHSDLGNFQLTCDYMQKAVDTNVGDKHKLFYNIGQSYGFLNNHRDAIKNYEKALEIDPDMDYALFNIGFSYGIIGNQERSMNYFNLLDYKKSKIIGKERDELRFWEFWGENALYNLKDVDKALKIFTEAKARPKFAADSTINYHLAVAYFTKATHYFETEQNYFECQKNAKEVMENTLPLLMKEQDDESITDLFYLNRDFEKALEHSLKGIAANPKSIDMNNAHGQILLKLDRVDEAIRFFKESLLLSGGEHDIRINLAEAYRRKGWFNEARFELQTVLEFDPNHIEALKGLLNLNIDNGDDSDKNEVDGYDAISYFEEAKTFGLKLLGNSGGNFRKLARPDVSHLRFLLAYTNYKLFFLNACKVPGYIKTALSLFSQVEPGSKYYYKSKSISAKIGGFLSKIDLKAKRGRAISVVGGSIVVFGLLLFLLGKPTWVTTWSFDKAHIEKLVAAKKLAVTDTAIFSNIEKRHFLSTHAADDFSTHFIKLVDKNVDLDRALQSGTEFSHLQQIDNILIFTILLAGIILIVMGYILDEVKSLKLPGGIELEKKALDYEMTPTAFKIER